MTWPTHTLLGISTIWLLTPFPPDLLGYDFGTLAACSALGALFPDLDASQSKIKHLKVPGTRLEPFRVPALIVSRTEQHRGLLHSLAGLGMVALMTMPLAFWTGWAPVAALLIGYASHLAGDSATKSGLRLFYPQTRRFHLLPHGWRITTGSLAEEVVAACWILPVSLLLLMRLFR